MPRKRPRPRGSHATRLDPTSSVPSAPFAADARETDPASFAASRAGLRPLPGADAAGPNRTAIQIATQVLAEVRVETRGSAVRPVTRGSFDSFTVLSETPARSAK